MLKAKDVNMLIDSNMQAIRESLIKAGIKGYIELECRGEEDELIFSTLYPLRDL